jgi:hypothetical protein
VKMETENMVCKLADSSNSSSITEILFIMPNDYGGIPGNLVTNLIVAILVLIAFFVIHKSSLKIIPRGSEDLPDDEGDFIHLSSFTSVFKKSSSEIEKEKGRDAKLYLRFQM